ncbi:hypothetical protein GCM10007863_18160 [Dyella mobilis]|nr:hypothetical protein GCM10007863_18160 [Dyella mobilis]
MRNATQNASVATLAPNTWLIEMSRNRPSTRDTMVMLLNDSSPRNMLGGFIVGVVSWIETGRSLTAIRGWETAFQRRFAGKKPATAR